MTKDRLEWVLSGLDKKKLNKSEKDFMKQIEKKFEQVESISRYEENRLEQIYRFKSNGKPDRKKKKGGDDEIT